MIKKYAIRIAALIVLAGAIFGVVYYQGHTPAGISKQIHSDNNLTLYMPNKSSQWKIDPESIS